MREFYANIEEATGTIVIVRKKDVDISPGTINAFYQVPDIGDDEYVAYCNGEPNFEEIVSKLCAPGTQWKVRDNRPPTIATKDLVLETKVWLLG